MAIGEPAGERTGRPVPGPRAVGGRCAASRRLLDIVDGLQVARRGSVELDALIDEALGVATSWLKPEICPGFAARQPARWSDNLGAALTVLPANYNFSLGQRDGICWAWIQPNDHWQPGLHESRHDHPGGSGLVVAYTAALALISAAITLYAGLLDPQSAL